MTREQILSMWDTCDTDTRLHLLKKKYKDKLEIDDLGKIIIDITKMKKIIQKII